MSTLAHLVGCHRILSARRTPIGFDALRERLGCSTATLKRVLTQLQDDFGAPLIRVRGVGVAYGRGEGAPFELPGFWLSAPELTALLLLEGLLQDTAPSLLAPQLAPIRDKAQQLLRSEGALPDWRHRLRLVAAGQRDAGPAFAPVASALVRRRQLEVRYRARSSGEHTTRRLSPQRLTRYRDRWYLDAYCHQRQALRSFAVERLAVIAECPEPAEDVPVAALDVALASSYGIFSGEPTATAELVFTAEAARWAAEEQWHPEQEAQWLPDGRWRLCLPYHHDAELLGDVLRFGEGVEVLGPPPLRKAMAQRLQRALAQYGA